MGRNLYFGLAAVFACALTLGLLILNYESSGVGDAVDSASNAARIYSLDNILCALGAGCDADSYMSR